MGELLYFGAAGFGVPAVARGDRSESLNLRKVQDLSTKKASQVRGHFSLVMLPTLFHI